MGYRTIGSYVLVSHQSQTCSSHYTEPCITTRTPLDPAVRRGNLLILKYDEDPLVREKDRQTQRWKSWCTAKPQQPSMHELGRACCRQKELLGSGMQHDIKTLQKEVDDKKAERETLIYVG